VSLALSASKSEFIHGNNATPQFLPQATEEETLQRNGFELPPLLMVESAQQTSL